MTFRLNYLAGVVLAVLMAVTPAFSQAQTSSVSDLVARMNAIVQEMDALKREFAALQSQVDAAPAASVSSSASTNAGQVLGAATTNLQTAVVKGATNDTIAKVQRLLATDPAIYDHPFVTGLFGPVTEESIKNFQTRFGLDPVGVVGPATSKLLLEFFIAYPNEAYPTNVLESRPQVATTPTPTVAGASVSTNSGSSAAESIEVTFEDDETVIELELKNGKGGKLFTDETSEAKVIAYIVSKTDLTTADVSAVISFEDDRDEDEDEEEEAEDAIDDAEDAIDDAEEAIEEADDDGEDVDKAEDLLEEAEEALEDAEDAYDDEDFDDAIEYAEEAEELAEEAEDAIGDDNDDEEIEEIKVDVRDGESDVEVEYENGDDEEFTVEEDDEDDIIEEIADELNIDEDEVEDVIEFDYGDIEDIDITVEDGEARVTMEFESGVELRFVLDEDDEDDIIEEIADRFDEDEDDIEDVADFDFND